MKIRLCLLLSLAIPFMCSCKSESLSQCTNSQQRFVILASESDGSVIYDTETGVEYWKSYGYSNRGTLTVLVDADGKPLIYKGE